MDKRYSSISINEFEVKIKQGEMYVGIVEGVGYVYWMSDDIYFVNVNENNNKLIQTWIAPKYQQVVSPFFIKGRRIYTKKQYTLYVMSRDQLSKFNLNLYNAYYGWRDIIEGNSIKRDATNVVSLVVLSDIPLKKGGKSASQHAVKVFDGTTSIAKDLDIGIFGKKLDKYLSIGKTAVKIVSNISDGEYFAAGGEIIETVIGCSVGLYVEIGMSIYKLDCMQEQLARNHAKQYKYYERLYVNARDHSSAQKRYSDKMRYHLKMFKKCMDNLNIKY